MGISSGPGPGWLGPLARLRLGCSGHMFCRRWLCIFFLCFLVWKCTIVIFAKAVNTPMLQEVTVFKATTAFYLLGFTVGNHTHDAHHQQSHANPCDCQDSFLVEFLCLCHCHTHKHADTFAQGGKWNKWDKLVPRGACSPHKPVSIILLFSY